MTEGLVISWVPYHGRSAALASELGYVCEFVYTDRKLPAPIRYFFQAFRTWNIVRSRNFAQVIVMLPPLPALICVILAGQPRNSIVGDLHTGFFLNPRWRWLTGTGLRLLRGGRAIVTNDSLAEICRRRGVGALVMHDVLRKPSEILNGGREITEISEHPVVLCPLSYANDEPVDSILEAATLLPDVVFVFTGNAPAWVIRIAPENITFSGYISNDEYWTLLQSSCGVLALTNRDLTMQRAGYEALLAGKPHVTSDFEVLRDFYGQAAIYTQPSGEEIAKSLLEMIQNANELCHAAVNVLAKRSAEQQEAIHALTRENVEWRHGG